MPRHDPSSRIKALTGLHRMPLDEIAQSQHRRERVAELHDTECRNDGNQAEEIRDGGRNDESDGPVNGNDDGPEDFAFLGGQRGRAEQIHEYVVVEHFDADIAV